MSASTQIVAATAGEPGLYPGVDALDYHAWPGASQTRLNIIRQHTPAHLRWALDHPEEPTAAMRLGAAIHTCVLEPDSFRDRYVRNIEGDGRTKLVKDAREALAQAYPHAIVLPPRDFDAALAVRDSVLRHPTAKALLGGQHEASAVWRDADTGLLCRGRFDDLSEGIAALTDLKKTVDAHPLRFPRTVYQYGYHIQAAHYMAGAKALGLAADSFAFVAVESEPPYAVAVYQLETPAILDGDRERRQLLARWAECEASGVWPGYPTDVVKIDLPTWATYEIDKRLELQYAE